MKIIFHPSYDSGYYLNLNNNTDNILGTKVVGLNGLLEHLSLKYGLSGRFASDGERAASYLTHVSKCAKGSIVDKAFANDSLGVAKCVLSWRDSLIMAGWTPEQAGSSETPKLQLLSKIESTWKGQMKGNADRWWELLTLSAQKSLADESTTIECRCAKEQLPKVVGRVLEACKASFAQYPEEIQIPDGLNVEVCHYTDLADAYRQVAAYPEQYRDAVIINRDNVSLNHVLFAWGQPLQNATINESNPLNLQLFKLALSVFSRPLNINNILSYLRLPAGPVPRRLRSALAYVLTSQCGFGEIDWNDLKPEEAEHLKKAGIDSLWAKEIYDYINTDDETSTLTKTQRESKTTLLKYITDASIRADEDIPVELLKSYIGQITQWASAVAYDESCEDEALRSQLNAVVSYFKQLANALEGIDKISYKDLENHVRTIYQPTSMPQARAQVGSLQVIGSYEQLVDAPGRLVWLDCSGADQLADHYEFLSATERRWLNAQAGIVIPCLKDVLELNRKEMILSVAQVTGKVTLVTSDYHHNQKRAEHPLVAELKMQRAEALQVKEGSLELPLSASKEVRRLEPHPQYQLDAIGYEGRSESNTSLDSLINYPFDYTVNYIAKLREASSNELGSLKKMTGLVAHNFIQRLVEDTQYLPDNERVTEIDKRCGEEFDKRLEASVKATGLSLFLKENEVVYNNLQHLLRRSVESLIEIMKQKKLIPVGCELKYEEPLGDVVSNFNARIDMELKDDKGNAVVFDFKWSYANFYGDKIKEGKSLQLELYRQELERQGKRVAAVGYYLLPKCQLETADYDTLKDPTTGDILINHIEPSHDADLFEQIENSVAQRLREIEAGQIEEGEGMDIKDLPYTKALTEGANILSIGELKKKSGTVVKSSNMVFTSQPESRFTRTSKSYESDDTPLNEKATTYPLMKGRLK